MSDWHLPAEEDSPPEDNVGAELRRLFDVEKEDLPPLFFETLQLTQGIDEEIAGYKNLEEEVLRRFFKRIGRDYDAWRREKQRQRRRRWVAALATSLLLAMLTVWLFSQPQVLEAVRRPLAQWFSAPPTPVTAREVTKYWRVAEIQSYFSEALPPQPPAGFRLVEVVLERGFPAGPRAMIFYQRGDPLDPDDPGVSASLVVWSLQDEPFPLPPEVVPEPVDLNGQPASWVEGTVGGSQGQAWQHRGGNLLWERDGWKFLLFSSALSREELVQIALQLVRQ